MTTTNGNRPRPLTAAAMKAGGAGAALLLLVQELGGLLVELGMRPALAAVIVRLLVAGLGVAIAFGVRGLGERNTTPVDDPVDRQGHPLVPEPTVNALATATAAAAEEATGGQVTVELHDDGTAASGSGPEAAATATPNDSHNDDDGTQLDVT